jgi:hypothetical protein
MLRMMASGACDITRGGEDGVKEQQAAKFDLRTRVRRQRGGAGQGFDLRVRQRIVSESNAGA